MSAALSWCVFPSYVDFNITQKCSQVCFQHCSCVPVEFPCTLVSWGFTSMQTLTGVLPFDPAGDIRPRPGYVSTYLGQTVVPNFFLRDSIAVFFNSNRQWLKCNGTQGNAVPPPPIYESKRCPTSDCYNARERHTTIIRGLNLNVAFPTSNFAL